MKFMYKDLFYNWTMIEMVSLDTALVWTPGISEKKVPYEVWYNVKGPYIVISAPSRIYFKDCEVIKE